MKQLRHDLRAYSAKGSRPLRRTFSTGLRVALSPRPTFASSRSWISVRVLRICGKIIWWGPQFHSHSRLLSQKQTIPITLFFSETHSSSRGPRTTAFDSSTKARLTGLSGLFGNPRTSWLERPHRPPRISGRKSLARSPPELSFRGLLNVELC
ncbi:hypothetical protein VTI28DRAFT_433 [Corynascus sepedonium]